MIRVRVCAIAAVLVSAVVALSGCAASGPAQVSDPALIRVPQDASLAQAGTQVADGGVILIAPGTYHETLQVRADDVTVRGQDRNTVILDGQLTRANGIIASGARVAVENLTVRDFTQNGVLITGVTDKDGAGTARGPDGYDPENVPPPVPGYEVSFVTAQNNGLYGIYAFNRSGGTIHDNLASGGSDSGIYVGQCAHCGALVKNNVLVSNAVGLEFANASEVIVTENRIVRNRVGVSVLSNYLEANAPSTGVRIVGNLIADNNDTQTPVQATGGLGIGIGLGGTTGAEIRANRITGNDTVGLWLTSSEDFAPVRNRAAGNHWKDNGLDVAFAPDPGVAGHENCFTLPRSARTVPADLATVTCTDDITAGQFTPPQAFEGIVFSKVPAPPQRPGLPEAGTAPAGVQDAALMPDLSAVEPPSPTFLQDPQ